MSKEQAHSAWRSADVIKRLSDRVIGLGPFGIGLDGILAWIPGANVVYGVGAGAMLMFEGLRAKASLGTLARMAMYIAADNMTDAVPLAGQLVDTESGHQLSGARRVEVSAVGGESPCVGDIVGDGEPGHQQWPLENHTGTWPVAVGIPGDSAAIE